MAKQNSDETGQKRGGIPNGCLTALLIIMVIFITGVVVLALFGPTLIPLITQATPLPVAN